MVFVEKGLSLLNKEGRLGFILPSQFFATDDGECLRNLIAEHHALFQLVDFGHLQVFEQAAMDTCLLFLSGSKQEFIDYAKVSTPQGLANADLRKIKNLFTALPWIFPDE
jgi:hypothetical protein